MADNVTLPGNGAVIATDEVDGAEVQIVKPAFGANGAAQVVDASHPLPATDAGVGDIDDPPAADDTSAWSLVSIGKAMLGRLLELIDRIPAGMAIFSDRLGVNSLPSTPEFTAGPMTAVGHTVVLTPVEPRGGWASFMFTGVGSASFAIEMSFDAGVTWVNCPFFNPATTNVTMSTGLTYTSPIPVQAQIPPGVNQLRTRCTAYTSGTVNCTITWQPETPAALTINPVIATGSNTIGKFFVNGQQQDDSSTALGANATFTGTSRDLTGANSGTSWTASVPGASSFRAISASDVVGTLHLEISRDNATWRRVKTVAAAQPGGAGLYVAEIEYKPAARYCRLVYVNGAGAQSHFLLQSLFGSLL